MLQTFKNAWKIPELRKKMLFTLFILVLFRIGSVIPVPFVYANLVQDAVNGGGLQGLFQYFNIISGEAFSKATLRRRRPQKAHPDYALYDSRSCSLNQYRLLRIPVCLALGH